MKLYDIAINRPIFITCVVLVMLVVGAFCFKALPLDQYPDMTFPMVSIVTNYPGAGPAEIETLVTKPIEEEVSSVSGMKRLTSNSMEGVSQVMAEFTFDTDIKYAEQRIRDKMSVVKSKLPTDVKDPVIRRMDPADSPILTFSLEADSLSDGQLYDFADQSIKPQLEQVNGVGMVDITGGRKREIHVMLDREKLRARELSVLGVANRISSSGENIPGGKVNIGTREMVFRSLGEFNYVKEISGTLLNLYGNQAATRVSDVGAVADTLEDETSRVFVNGKKSLFINVYRQSGGNTLNVANEAKAKMTEIQETVHEFNGKPVKPVITKIVDGSREIRNNVDDVYETIIIGVILTIIVVFLFLANGKSTFITVLALPNSMIGAFILMYFAGFTINLISLMALSIAVGLLIDDAIVVRENIFRHRELGEDPVTSAKNGTEEVQMAVIATSLVV
jgi:HAE1 family hydrophobic/amphiphilic exporter-1